MPRALTTKLESFADNAAANLRKTKPRTFTSKLGTYADSAAAKAMPRALTIVQLSSHV